MDTHRINGIKMNFDRLSDAELEGMRGHLLEQHARLVGEIALVESTLLDRHPLETDNVVQLQLPDFTPPDAA